MTSSTLVWVLSFTVLGVVPEHGNIAKFLDKKACEQALDVKKKELSLIKKQVVGTCNLKLTTS